MIDSQRRVPYGKLFICRGGLEEGKRVAKREPSKGNDASIVWYDWHRTGVYDVWTGVVAFACASLRVFRLAGRLRIYLAYLT